MSQKAGLPVKKGVDQDRATGKIEPKSGTPIACDLHDRLPRLNLCDAKHHHSRARRRAKDTLAAISRRASGTQCRSLR
jgi:hypothetical protein